MENSTSRDCALVLAASNTIGCRSSLAQDRREFSFGMPTTIHRIRIAIVLITIAIENPPNNYVVVG